MPRPKSRDPESDPIAALGEELERLRVAGGFSTQDALARKAGFGREAITKVESGAEVPSENLYQKWLEVCEASEETRHFLDRMLADARRSRSATPEFAKPWLKAERLAEFLLLWSLDLVPGPLQVREYTYDMFARNGYSEAEATAKTEERLKRQSILEGSDPVHVTVVMHESALDRRVGSPATMARQLEHLLKVSEFPNVIIQVVRGDDYFLGREGAFYIASGDSILDTLVMVVAIEDQTTQDKALVRKATKLFREIQSRALNVEETRTFIRERLERWRSQQ
jgi:transcriptional regulator with XRE-family HTH domain